MKPFHERLAKIGLEVSALRVRRKRAKDGFDVYGSSRGIEGVVMVRKRHLVIRIETAHPMDMVDWPYG